MISAKTNSQIFQIITSFMDILLIVLVVYFIWNLIISDNRPLWKRRMENIILPLSITVSLTLFIKMAVHIGEPDQAWIGLSFIPNIYRFPSGHTSRAFALATAISFEKPLLMVPAYILATTVGFSRIYLGVHYPSDVIAGAMLGVTVSLLYRKAIRSYSTLVGRPPVDIKPSGSYYKDSGF